MGKIHCLFNGGFACGVKPRAQNKAKFDDFKHLYKEERCESCARLMKARGYEIKEPVQRELDARQRRLIC